jgi:predicted transcriptional regulator
MGNVVDNRKKIKVNKDIAIIMAIQGKSYEAIAEHFGVTKQAISKHLTPLREHIEQRKIFHEHPDMVWEDKEQKLLNSVDDQDIKKMNGYQKFGSAGLCRTQINEIRGTGASNKPTINLNIKFDGIQVKSVDAVGDGSKTIDIT